MEKLATWRLPPGVAGICAVWIAVAVLLGYQPLSFCLDRQPMQLESAAVSESGAAS